MKKENKKVNMTDPIMIDMMKKCEKQALTKMKDHDEIPSEGMSHDKMEHKKVIKKKEGEEHKH